MGWVVPNYSRGAVDRAGATYVDLSATPEDRGLALAVINNWRASHSFPLNTFQMTLRRKAIAIDPDVTVAQRLKRLPSIRAKLERFHGMSLARMQDIGGCRAVMVTPASVKALAEQYLSGSLKHELVREDNYIQNPKESGYRSHHLVYRYYSDKNTTYNRLQIEVQIRSRIQHAWATAVETVDTFTRQALKSSSGETDWMRFFALMSSELAIRENTPTVPGTPSNRDDLTLELCDLARRLNVVNRLQAYGAAVNYAEANAGPNDKFWLLELDTTSNQLTVRRYDNAAKAAESYRAIETVTEGDLSKDVVLVAVDSIAQLRRAYPNYFLDTSAFVRDLNEVLRREQRRVSRARRENSQ